MDVALHTEESLAVAGWPSGLLGTALVEWRAPLYRSESIVFQDTALGLGGMVLASPVFVGVGPRVAIAPIDVFDVNLKFQRWQYWKSGSGLGGVDALTPMLESTRDVTPLNTGAWVGTVEPTLKLKVGSVIAVGAWTIDWFHVEQPGGYALLYEPFRDLVVAPDDWLVEQMGIVLYEFRGDPNGIRVGATVVDRRSLNAGDLSTRVGLIGAVRPADKPGWPTFVSLVNWYVVDGDRVGPIPYMAMQAQWSQGDLP